jgi:hypothetical protein
MPPPIRTRPVVQPAWEDSLPPQHHHAGHGDHSVAVELSALKEMIEERFNTLAWLGSSKQNPIQSGLMLKLIRAGYSPASSPFSARALRTGARGHALGDGRAAATSRPRKPVPACATKAA